MLDRLRGALQKFRYVPPLAVGVREAYARWADVYPPVAHNPFMQREQQELLSLLPEVAGKTALDVGCGTGRYIEILRERGAIVVVGIDLSSEMLQRARARGAIARADLRALPIRSACIDVVTAGLTVGHVADLAPAVAEMSRVLVAGGVLVYSDFHPFARLNGNQRVFSVDGRSYAVEHYVHLYSAHHVACRAVGLEIEDVREALTTTDNPFPAVLAIRARRRG